MVSNYPKKANVAVLGVGSNIRPEENIRMLKQRVGEIHRIIAESQWLKTTPIGRQNQPDFTNGAILIETSMDRRKLRVWLKQTERELGRTRHDDKFGPRSMDVDIVVWNGKIVHPDVYKRDFLLNAVKEVCPDCLKSNR